MPGPVVVSGVVEGPTDRVALARLMHHAGLAATTIYDTGGKSRLLQRLAGYNNAARFSPWVVLIDLDSDADCAPPFIARCLPQPATHMVFRVAVRALEAWLLADVASIAAFLRIPPARVPPVPDDLSDPKRALVDLAAGSRQPDIRDHLVPRPGSGRRVGPAYTSRLVEFIEHHWDIDNAATRSESLARCLEQLRSIPEEAA